MLARRTVPIWSGLLVAAVAAIALVLGVELAAGAVIGGALCLALVVGLRAERVPRRVGMPDDARAAPPLGPMIAGALALRVTLALVLNLTDLYGALAPDSGLYRLLGRYIAASWSDPTVSPYEIPDYKPLSFYMQLNGLATYLAGDAAMVGLAIVNAFVGTLAAWVVARLATDLFGARAGHRAFALAAFFPSLVLWSSLNLRDVWSFLFVTGAVLSAGRLCRGTSAQDVLRLGACLAVIPFIRSYMLIVMGAALILSFAAIRFARQPLVLPVLAALAVLVLALLKGFGVAEVPEVGVEEQLVRLDQMRHGMATAGRSAYGSHIDASTPAGALLYLPYGVTHYLFAPFPWSVHSWRQLVALPESIAWYLIFADALKGLWRSARADLARVVVPIAVIFTTTLAYSLVEGEEGNAYRHRGQVVLLCIVFAAAEQCRARR